MKIVANQRSNMAKKQKSKSKTHKFANNVSPAIIAQVSGDVARTIRKILASKGLDAKSFAEQTGVSTNRINAVLEGRPLTLRTMVGMFSALGFDIHIKATPKK